MDYMDEYEFGRPYMVGDEYILWKGKPEKGALFTGREIIMLPFALIWLAFSVFWELTAIFSGAPLFFCLWGIPFIGICIYLLIGRFFHMAYLRKRTFYIITNKKIMIKRGNRIEMHDGKSLPPMDIRIHKNGNGTITFCDNVYMSGRRRYGAYFALENLADVVAAQNAVSMKKK